MRSFQQRFRRSIYLQLLILPGLLYFLIFHYGPIFGLVLAFKDFQIGDTIFGAPWAARAGFHHFFRFFTYPFAWRLIRNTAYLSFLEIAWGFWVPILLALFLNELRMVRYKKAIQTVIFLPRFISSAAVVGMLFLLLSPGTGVVNRLIQAAGMDPVHFMTRPEWFRTVYVASNIWQSSGWGAIVYLAALTTVDADMYEAATIDGATRWQKAKWISIPAIIPTIVIMLLLQLGRIMSVGTERILLMYNPTTYATADVIGTYLYRRGLVHAEYSYGAAVGMMNSIINVLFILGFNRLAKKLTDQGLW